MSDSLDLSGIEGGFIARLAIKHIKQGGEVVRQILKYDTEQLRIPIDIERDLIGGDDTGPAQKNKEA